MKLRLLRDSAGSHNILPSRILMARYVYKIWHITQNGTEHVPRVHYCSKILHVPSPPKCDIAVGMSHDRPKHSHSLGQTIFFAPEKVV